MFVYVITWYVSVSIKKNTQKMTWQNIERNKKKQLHFDSKYMEKIL